MQTHRPCVSIVLIRTEKDKKDVEVLLVHKPRKNDAWQIPQGGIEEGETMELAAKRELREETGIVLLGALHPSRHRYQYDYPAGFLRAKKPRYRGQRLDFFAARVSQSQKVEVDKRELDRYRWVKPEALGTFLKRKEYLEVVERVIEEYRSKGSSE